MPAVERAVTLECAGNGRLETRPLPVGEPWGDYAVSTARWKGALLTEVLEHAHPAADGLDVRFEGADHGPYHLKPVLAETNQSDLRFVRSLALAHATDPAAEILIAYEMNGQPLIPDHGALFRLIVPHWYAVASVKWLKRIDVLTEPYVGEFQTGHYIYQGRIGLNVSRDGVEPASPIPLPARRSPPASTPFAERHGKAPGRQSVHVSFTGERTGTGDG
jgi:DMSO/TMAO reductase YedYZ molybdopterin-dependent catalytic subunit